ncbi:MAG TPA: aminotransferase class V-fold PLP-dependent enzyme [Negativicutes bacterium]
MDTVYMNNAATSWPKAPEVGQVVCQRLAAVPHHAGRAGFSAVDVTGDCRQLLAKLFAIPDSNQIVLCANATYALNIALHGFPWKEGATVITTTAEHNSVLRPLHYLRKHRNIKVEFIPVDQQGRMMPERWLAAIRKFEPQLAIFTHASNVTGAINDAEVLGNLARQAGVATLLDASQTAGFVDVLPETWGIDMAVFTGHKYLLGPPGTGGLYVSPAIRLEPVWVGGTGVQSDLAEMPEAMPTRFEAGTPNDPALGGLAHALAWQQEFPCNKSAVLQQLERLAAGLLEAGVSIIDVSAPRTPVLSFTARDWELEEIGEILQKSFGIICRTGLHCAPIVHQQIGTAPQGSIRLSISRFTTAAEIDYCIAAIKLIIEV